MTILVNQGTSGPVIAHLTPGPGIYFNFLYMYIAQGRGRQLLWDNVDVNRKPLPLCPYVASFKMISSKSDFIHIFDDFIHVYSPGARAENPLGTNF